MNIEISYTSDKPMYEQIKDSIRQAIFGGEFKNNDMLPSVRQLAKDLNVSMITTKRAYIDLEHEGFVYTVSGKGTFIKINNIDEIQRLHEKEMLQKFENHILSLKEAGILKSKLFEIIFRIFGGNENE
ncbi:MAG: GntR family transcriptional regulator [Oscillospiraceae bacterium]|jgi:GntR family transcriptional regulator